MIHTWIIYSMAIWNIFIYLNCLSVWALFIQIQQHRPPRIQNNFCYCFRVLHFYDRGMSPAHPHWLSDCVRQQTQAMRSLLRRSAEVKTKKGACTSVLCAQNCFLHVDLAVCRPHDARQGLAVRRYAVRVPDDSVSFATVRAEERQCDWDYKRSYLFNFMFDSDLFKCSWKMEYCSSVCLF